MLHGTRTIGRLLKHRVQKSSHQKAIGWVENLEVKSLNFLDYKNTIQILVAAFHKIGIQVGDKIAIISETCKEWHFFDMATLNSRCCLVPIYPSYSNDETEYIFNHSDSSILIVENDKQLRKMIPYFDKLHQLKIIISINELEEETLKKFRNAYPYYNYKDLLRLGQEVIVNTPDLMDNLIENQSSDEIATIVYTSGTTGTPKGVVITQHALTSMLLNIESAVKGTFHSGDRTLTFLPLSHVLGRCDSLLPLVFGWESVYAESKDRLLENLRLVKPTVMIVVPRVLENIFLQIKEQFQRSHFWERQIQKFAVNSAEKYFAKIDKDLSPSALEIGEYALATKLVFEKIYNQFGGKLRYFVCGGAPLSEEIFKLLRSANLNVLEGYGLSETVSAATLNPLSRQVSGTVGRPMGDVEISFGPDKEILIKSAALMKEYYKDPQSTDETLKNGFLYTGDIGEFTIDGYLKITDRKKDIIVMSSGKKVAPQKIENLAKLKPHISQLAIFGDNKSYITALVGIEKEKFLNLIDEQGLSSHLKLDELAKHRAIKEIIQKEIDEINTHLAYFETIRKFSILPIELTVGNYLTPSFKLKRKHLQLDFQEIIDQMYREGTFDD